MSPATAHPLFVLDDDPTGPQGQADVPLLLSIRPELVKVAASDRPRALHLLTNSRALSEEGAYGAVRDAARAVEGTQADARIVLRGDSTLRAHLLPEYEGLRDALGLQSPPPLLLVPALPAAGRITRGGRHLLIRDGQPIPLDRTEFAADDRFSYRSSRLLDWAEERSDGFFSASNGVELGLKQIRAAGGAEHVRDALLEASGLGEPVVVAPDAESESDLATIAEGLSQAWSRTPDLFVRCGPSFASVLSGAGASGPAALPSVRRGLLVVVGSHVPMSSTQLAALNTAHPDSLVEVDAPTLASAGACEAVEAAVERARELLARDRLAIVATTRSVNGTVLSPEAGMRIARRLAFAVDRLRNASDVLLSKGGITSAVNVQVGLHADRAQIVGPVAPGISLWRVSEGNGHDRPVIVFPGNVGDPYTLAELVDRLISE